ncbi:hypothetical protein GCM10009748_32860 [Agromyces lapidis]
MTSVAKEGWTTTEKSSSATADSTGFDGSTRPGTNVAPSVEARESSRRAMEEVYEMSNREGATHTFSQCRAGVGLPSIGMPSK